MIYTVTLNPALDRELTVADIRFDEVLRATDVRLDCGGKGLNVSRALHALGQPSVALGLVGGETGRRLGQGLARLGIRTDFVEIAGETRTNVSIVNADRSRHVKVNEPGPAVSPDEQAALQAKVAGLARAGDWWVLSGNLPRGVCPTFYADLARLLQAAGAFVVLDSSGDALLHGCRAGPDLVKPNASEAAEITGIAVESPHRAGAAVRAMIELGVKYVFMTFGRDGALVADARRSWFAAAPSIQERNPIGAGDCALAGLVWGLSQGMPLPEALRWGVACGAAAAHQAGTAVGGFELVASLAEQVVVEALEAGAA